MLLHRPSFFLFFVTGQFKIKYGKNWRNKERKNEPFKSNGFSFFAPPIFFLIYLPDKEQKN